MNRQLQEIICGCREESRRPRAAQPGDCFELFRRAIDERCDEAWRAVVAQYHPLVCRWLLQLGKGRPQEHQVMDLADCALARFWHTLRHRDAPLAAQFDHVGAVLSYLRHCAASTYLDADRRDRRQERLRERVALFSIQHNERGMEQRLLERLDRTSRVNRVVRWVSVHVTDPQERIVLALSFDEGLTPQQIAAAHPEYFEGAAAVRRIKERVLKRVRRAVAG
jgi:RNA polymerase sigma factor (sigma-70 family)